LALISIRQTLFLCYNRGRQIATTGSKMMSTDLEFEKAFRKMKETHPNITWNNVNTLIRHMRSIRVLNNKQGLGREFYQDLRPILDCYKLVGRDRYAYRSLLGSYYGRRGGKKTRKADSENVLEQKDALLADMEAVRLERHGDPD
jgi:hypothetical protein